MAKPLISVVVPAFNAAAHLGAALASVAAQEGPFEIEILVVDDGSTDDTAAIAQSFSQSLGQSRLGVRLVRQSNGGPSAARNRGIALSRGELVAFLDADDLWPADRLRCQLALLAAEPQAGLVLGDCRLFCDLGERPRTLFEESGLDLAYWGGPALVQDPYGKLIRLNFIATGAVLVRRPVLELAGGFDPALRLVEDLDLWLRLALVCPFAYTTQVCEHKREHGGNVSGDRDAMALAYIRVLLAQASRRPGELRRRGIRIGPIVASEYSQIGYRREQARDRAGARRFYWAALAAHPSPRPLYYLARTWLPGRTAGTLGGGTRQGGAAP